MRENTVSRNLKYTKPSELCHVSYFTTSDPQTRMILTAPQLDTLNVLYYFIIKEIDKKTLTLEDLELSPKPFKITLTTIADLLGKYKAGGHSRIVTSINVLSTVGVIPNMLNKNAKYGRTPINSIITSHEFNTITEKNGKYVTFTIHPEILSLLIKKRKMYAPLSLHIQNVLVSRYSKLLYEILKDYSPCGEKHIEFGVLLEILNVNEERSPCLGRWSSFNTQVLHRAIKEINEHSDIAVCHKVSRKMIINQKDKKVMFFMKTQTSTLIDSSLEKKQKEIAYSQTALDFINTPVYLSPVETKYLELAKMRMSIYKSKPQYVPIKNEKKYLSAIVNSIKDDIEMDIPTMIGIDEILATIKQDNDQLRDDSIPQLIVFDNYNKKSQIITINSEYCIYVANEETSLTHSIKETYTELMGYITNGGTFSIRVTKSKIPDYIPSYM